MIAKLSERPGLVATLLLSLHAALLAWAATRHSPSIDEVGHMAAGLSHWHFGRFDLYRVNPPLVRLVATMPVALTRPRSDWSAYSLLRGARGEFECGEQFIAANGEWSFWLFTVARWACIPFSLLGGYVCYRWAGELYGPAGGLLAVALWCFCPNLLAHGQMITPDVGATSLGVLSCYLFWKWIRAPSWPRTFTTGIALGLAELTKATFLVLYAVWPLAWLFWRLARASKNAGQAFQPDGSLATLEERQAGKPGLRQAGQLVLMAALGLYVLNLGYAFEGPLQPLGEFHFLSAALGGPRDMGVPGSARRNRFSGTGLAGLRVPLPANYVLGIDHQKYDFEQGFPSYLHGEWRHGGWWYYYLYGLAIKVPLGTWLLFLMAVTVGITLRVMGAVADISRGASGTIGGATWRDEFVLLLPAAVIFALVSSQTGFNHHLRYVLPIFPFVFIWIGRLGRLFADPTERHRLRSLQETAERHEGRVSKERHGVRSVQMMAVGLALAWSIGSSLWYYPHSLSYFNELVGGPLGGRWHMLDSNLDWGQDLLYLKTWLGEHPEARPLGLAYFGYFDPRAAGIEFSLPPHGPVHLDNEGGERRQPSPTSSAEIGPLPGWYAVSVTMLHGYQYAIPDGKGGKFYTEQPYFTYFQRFEPVARAGYSIYIYHLELPEVNRVRRELGLRELDAPPAHNVGGGG
ncbi:MAG TPA: glycosyltransferase family 39 protein [Pirellulales bacterium]|nr:glycosyltransferase family 39 protein [Pirellulales bacterium]